METTSRLAAMAERLSELEARREMIEVEISALRAALAAQLDVGEVVEVHDTPMYTLRPGKRVFQQDIAATILQGSPILEEVTVTRIDGKALKAVSESVWQACCTTGQPYLQALR